MSVIAKFICTENKTSDWGDGKIVHNVTMWPVIDGNEENKSFYAATPGGNIQLSVLNEAAGKQFEEGKEYYVDFTPAETK